MFSIYPQYIISHTADMTGWYRDILVPPGLAPGDLLTSWSVAFLIAGEEETTGANFQTCVLFQRATNASLGQDGGE